MIRRRLKTSLPVDRNASSITVMLWITIKKQEWFNQLMGFFQNFSKILAKLLDTYNAREYYYFILNTTLHKVCISMKNLHIWYGCGKGIDVYIAKY